MQSAQASAQVIDTTLAIITSIPFLFVDPYSTQKPLAEALKDVSLSLDPIAQPLSSMEESLQAALGNLDRMENQFTQIAADIKAINQSVSEAKTGTNQYLDHVAVRGLA